MPRLRVDLQELAMAFDDHGSDMRHYLDMETGRVISLARLRDRETTMSSEKMMTKSRNCRARSGWIQAEHATRAEVCAGQGTRYIDIPGEDRHEAYCDMKEFIATVQESRLQARLAELDRGNRCVSPVQGCALRRLSRATPLV